jgi:ubiquinone/menaquinone biosynthesis C-methylase UbiE
MSERKPPSLAADSLTPAEIESLKQSERRGRDQGAATYLRNVRATMGAYRYRAEDLVILHHLGPRAGERVLEAGAGVGRQALRVAPRVGRLVCVDFSAKALEVLAAEAQRRGLPNVETLTADLCDLPATLHDFDRVYSVAVLPHIPSHAQRLAALRGFHRILRPGGACLVEVPCYGPRARMPKEGFLDGGTYQYLFSPAELRALLEEAGFVDVSVHGMIVLPGRLTRRFPATLAFLELWCSLVPALAGSARRLIATGRRAPDARSQPSPAA